MALCTFDPMAAEHRTDLQIPGHSEHELHSVCWERLIADAFACPARQLNRCSLGAAFGASSGMTEPIARGVLTQENDEGRQRYRDIVEAG